MAIQRRKTYKSKLVFHQYQRGELVWVKNKTGRRKVSRSLSPRWIGPYVVVRPIFDVVYVLKLPHGSKEITLHHDALKPYVQREGRVIPENTSRSSRSWSSRPVKRPTSTENQDNTVGCESTDSGEESPSEAKGGAEDQPGMQLEQENQRTSPEPPVVLRRSKRIRKLPRRLDDYVLEPNDGEDSDVVY